MKPFHKLLILFLLSLLLAGCQAEPEPNTLIVGFIPDAAPFTYLNDEGFCTGFEIELIEQAAAIMNLVPQYTQVTWDELQSKISEGRIDLFVGYLTEKDLPDGVLLSQSYLDNSQVFMIRTNQSYESPLDFAGKTITVFENSLSHQLIQWEYQKEITDTWLIQYSTNMETALEDLLSGKTDAWLSPLYSVKDLVAQYPEDLSFLPNVFYQEKLVTAFSAERENLVEQYNLALQKLQTEGKLSEIALGWFGFDPTAELVATP